MSPSPAPSPSPWKSLLRDLGGLAALIVVALLLLAVAIWLESPPGRSVHPFEWLASLDSERAGGLLGVASQLVAGVLAIVITVAAIVVELAANRYTSRITQLFVREPTNFLLMGLYVVTTLLCLWLSAVPELDAEAPSRVPRAGLLIGFALVSLCLAALLPYFGFLFRFLAPTNVIARIRGLAVASIQRARTRTEPGARISVIEAIEELEDVARSAREHSDRSISMAAISALGGLLRDYAPLRRELPASWFEIEGDLLFDPDFVSMAPAAVVEIREQRIWLETKVLRQYLALFGESLGDARDVANLIALETRRLGVESIENHPNLLGLVIRFFNSYLRAAVNGRDQRTAYYVLDQYRLLGEATLAAATRSARWRSRGTCASTGSSPTRWSSRSCSRPWPTTSRAWSSAPWRTSGPRPRRCSTSSSRWTASPSRPSRKSACAACAARRCSSRPSSWRAATSPTRAASSRT